MTTRVKICGLNDEASMAAALDAGADLVGLVFYSKSPRNISTDTARGLAAIARNRGHAKVVALVVDPDETLLQEIVSRVEPDYLQLHGHETPERVAAVRARFGIPLIKAVPVASRGDVEAAMAYFAPGLKADIVLFDAKPGPAASLPGGNGLAFDWHLLDGLDDKAPYALAGGLNPENVAAAIRLTGIGIVDVSSGVETAPGHKSTELIRRFLQAAKASKQKT